MLAWAEPIYGDWYKEEQSAAYSGGKTDALKALCGHEFYSVNKALRDSHGKLRNVKEVFRNKALSIHNLLSEIQLPDDIIAYRYIDDDHLIRMKNTAKHICTKRLFSSKKNYLVDFGFVSTTPLKSLCYDMVNSCNEKEDKYIMKILIPKNSIGAYVNYFSRRDDEMEFLLSFGCVFRIVEFNSDRTLSVVLEKQLCKRKVFNYSLWRSRQ